MKKDARNRQLIKERVEQGQLSTYTSVTHATVIALISKRVLNDALPRINLMTVLRKKREEENLHIYTRKKGKR